MTVTRLHVRVRGLVQGVGFRPWIYGLARSLQLTGWVRNDEEGVLLEVQGERAAELLTALRHDAPPLARLDAVEPSEVPLVPGDADFTIDTSARGGTVTVAIGPDAGVCRACLLELFTPADRRHLYPFLTCTHCGPRYTITRGLPYDRPQTSMAPFPLCADCAREYHDPLDRRFHAQPVACPACGPRLSHSPEAMAQVLRQGGIVAVKGLGGFLLACDATDEVAVTRLRRRKQRDGKPFAVMVLNAASARRWVSLDDAEEALLTSLKRPIVLARRGDALEPPLTPSLSRDAPLRDHTHPLAPDVAPDLAWVGVMLPSTPMQYLLLHALAGATSGTAWLDAPLDVALVMTSANLGGEPLITDNAEALERLAPLADLVVTHDRDIVVRADDSVARVCAGATTLIRRARGYVPEPVKLADDGPQVLALGAFLKTTLCLTRGREAFVSQHLGDLDDARTFAFLEETLEHLTRTLDVHPVAVAHDLHPDFLSTRKAQSLGLPCVAVQHHHAHLAAVMAEHRCVGPTVGLALDGFGLGTDGGSWGGELLRLDGPRFERLGHLAPLRQPGGDVAARQPWRMALAALDRLGQAHVPLPGAPDTAAVRQLLDKDLRSPWTSSCGRLFDAACGLLGVRPVASYEGEAPMVLESLVREPRVLADSWVIADGVLDLLPLLGALLGLAPAEGADLFHGTLAAALVEWATPVAQAHGHVVLLGGGCLLNRVLAEQLVERFARIGITALLPRQVPANDGGLSLGQAWVARETLRAGG